MQASDRVTPADVAGASGIGIGTTSHGISQTVAIEVQLALGGGHLTSFGCQPLQKIGAEAARRLRTLLRGEHVLPMRHVLAIEVVQQGSSAWPAGQSRQNLLPIR